MRKNLHNNLMNHLTLHITLHIQILTEQGARKCLSCFKDDGGRGVTMVHYLSEIEQVLDVAIALHHRTCQGASTSLSSSLSLSSSSCHHCVIIVSSSGISTLTSAQLQDLSCPPAFIKPPHHLHHPPRQDLH